ncbi:MAG: DUF2141 domain-containing protein [Sphingomonas sp.]
MLKFSTRAAAIGLALPPVLAATPAFGQYGPDAAACRNGGGATGSAILVNVGGFRERTGNIRVNVYGSNPSSFLARGQYVRQVNVPVARNGNMPICIAVPRAGRYAVAVRHDMDGNGRSGWSDGGGFSRNPRVSLVNLRPSYDSVAFNVGRGVATINVTLLYRYGLSIRPAA